VCLCVEGQRDSLKFCRLIQKEGRDGNYLVCGGGRWVSGWVLGVGACLSVSVSVSVSVPVSVPVPVPVPVSVSVSVSVSVTMCGHRLYFV
jgi:hypothetical protein